METKAITFDFDGVLAESTDVKTAAFQTLYEPFGKEVVAQVTQYHLLNGGISRFEKIRHYQHTFLGENVSETRLQELAQRFSELVVKKVIESSWVAGAKACLELHLGKLQLFIASGTPQEELLTIVEKREMSHYFREVYGSPLTKATHIRRILDDHSWEKDQVVMVGDSMSDWDAANETGIRFLGRKTLNDGTNFPEGTTVVQDLSNVRFK